MTLHQVVISILPWSTLWLWIWYRFLWYGFYFQFPGRPTPLP